MKGFETLNDQTNQMEEIDAANMHKKLNNIYICKKLFLF
jgi:hypothetical protein